MHGVRSVLRAIVLGAAAALVCAGAAGAANDPVKLELTALTGPDGTDLYVVAPEGITVFEHVHVRVFRPEAPDDASLSRNLKDEEPEDGFLEIDLRGEPAGALVTVTASAEVNAKTVNYRGRTTVKLRPDLTVTSVQAYRPCVLAGETTMCPAAQTLTTRPVDVVAEIAELNGETGATADVELRLGDTELAPAAEVTVEPGGKATVRFEDLALTTAMTAELEVAVDGAAPAETDVTNNDATATVEVTAHELVREDVLVPFLAGYGAQFNNHVYAPITPWPHDDEPDDDYEDFEEKVVALQPHIVRIFYNDRWDGNADGQFPEWRLNYASFVRSVRLAQEAGAIIDISFQNLGIARFSPGPSMAKFADVIEDLVVHEGLDHVRWAEVGNEPNSGNTSAVSLAEYAALVRALDSELRARGLDDRVQMMGPGLIENAGVPSRTHYVWAQWVAANLGDVLDAWGQHVYWNYNDTGRLEYRLRDIWHLMNEVLPPEQRKPVYMMEYGVRGLGACAGKPASQNTYYAADPGCPGIWSTNIAGFQQLWFAIESAQLGYAGASKWDAYWGVYDRTINPPQVYWTIGRPEEGSPLMPSYHALALLFHTTAPGWQVVRTAPWDESDWGVNTYGIEGHSSKDTPEPELATYIAPSGDITVLGLDTNGRALNGVSPVPPTQYSLGGLPANVNLKLVLWNESGDGTNTLGGYVPTNAAGVARFAVPLHAAFSLTTLPVS